MPHYRLLVHRHDKYLGHFDADTGDALHAGREIAARLPAGDGYRIEWLVAHAERRLLESGPDGLRVLSREPLFKPVRHLPTNGH